MRRGGGGVFPRSNLWRVVKRLDFFIARCNSGIKLDHAKYYAIMLLFFRLSVTYFLLSCFYFLFTKSRIF